MNIVIPFEGRVMTVIRSSFVVAKKLANDRYQLTGETFQMTDVVEKQVLLLSDTIEVTEGQVLTEEMVAQAMPFEMFVTVSSEEALPNALGLLLRLAVADGRVTDAELLSIQPALEGRAWQSGIAVEVGDVYTHAGNLWRCVQAHVTQSDWKPDLVPVLWRKVEVLPDDQPRVWQTGIDYVVGDVLAYPDVNGSQYECLQAHTSQEGWEPPNVPALWKPKDES